MPYSTHSESAADLSEKMGVLRIKRENSKLEYSSHRIIINWGCKAFPYDWLNYSEVLNTPNACRQWGNKINFFRNAEHEGIVTPRYWRTPYEIPEGVKTFGRTANGHLGRNVLRPDDQGWANSDLFVEQIDKSSEYRAYFFNGNVLAIYKVVLPNGVEAKDPDIRSYENGYIFQRNNVKIPAAVEMQAQQFASKMSQCPYGLDFGGIDLMYRAEDQKSFILEANTAPGITGYTTRKFAEAFQQYLDHRNGKKEKLLDRFIEGDV